MSVTPQQFADLRVEVATLAGSMKVTNERLSQLIDRLDKQGDNRKWLIGTFFTTLGTVAAFTAILATVILHI
jgi:hypothetical protein